MRRLRHRLFRIIGGWGAPGPGARIFDGLLVTIIVINLIAVTLETVEPVASRFPALFDAIEYVSVVIFTVEYLTRLWVCVEDGHYHDRPPWKARIGFALSPMGLIDLAAVLPSLLILAGVPLGLDLRVLRTLRMVRVLKLTRYSRAMQSIVAALQREKRTMVAALLIVVIALHFAATAVFLAEHKAQPDVFGSIPDAMWWSLATLTTVGYGDMVPHTILGKLIGGVVMLSGIGLFALWTGLFASSFVDELRRRDFKVSWEMVAQVPAFSRLEATQIGEIATLLQPLIVPPRHLIVRKGEHADRMYFIASGEVEAEFFPEPMHLGPGEFFGEVGLLHGNIRDTTVVSLSETQLMVLDADQFFELMKRHPEVNRMITETAAQRRYEPQKAPETDDQPVEIS